MLSWALNARAASGTWNVDAAGNWSTAGNWTPAAVPGTAAGDTVGLTYNITAARTVTIDTTSRTVGTLNIGDSGSSYFGYTLTNSGGASLTFNNSGSTANLLQTATTASDLITVPITLTDNLSVSNNSTLTLSGVISGSKGFTKTGAGTLIFSAANAYTGDNTVNLGTLKTTLSATSGTPFGTGSMMVSNGTLSLMPANNGINVANTGATAGGKTFTYAGATTLVLDRNGNPSLAYTVGSGSGTVLLRGTNGTLIITPTAIAELGAASGNSEKFIISGAAPTVVNNMVVGNIIGQASTSDLTGDFLTYDATTGLKSASASYTANPTAPTSTQIANYTTATTIVGAATAAYALRITGVNVTASATVNLTLGAGGIILNNGGTLRGGASQTINIVETADTPIYVGPGTCTMDWSSSGTFINTKYGPGALKFLWDPGQNYILNGGTIINACGGWQSRTITVNADGCGLDSSGKTYDGAITSSGGNWTLYLNPTNSNATTISGTVSAGPGLTLLLDVQKGSVVLGNSTAFATNTVSLQLESAATLDMNKFNATFGALSGSGTVSDTGGGGGAITVLTLAGTNSATFSGVISDGTKTTALVRTNTATQTLSGPNTFTGGSTIKGGTILIGVNNVSTTSGALGPSTAAVTLGDTTGSANASLLTAGAFTFANAVTVASGSSGAATLGGSTADASSFTGNVTLAKSAILTAVSGGDVTFSGIISGSGFGTAEHSPARARATRSAHSPSKPVRPSRSAQIRRER